MPGMTPPLAKKKFPPRGPNESCMARGFNSLKGCISRRSGHEMTIHILNDRNIGAPGTLPPHELDRENEGLGIFYLSNVLDR